MSQQSVDAAITSRRSVRAFLPTPVSQQQIGEILDVARHAPSGSNTQPWRVTALTGEPLSRLSAALLEADEREPEAHEEEYYYYPREWVDPYLARRRRNGWGLYGVLGIEKGDRVRMREQFRRNYVFFDAPVGLIFTIDRVLEQGSWLDYGMFLQNVMIAARARGLDTCPQAAFCTYHRVIKEQLALPPEQMVVCGMALGYADHEATANRFRAEREPAESFTTMLGFTG